MAMRNGRGGMLDTRDAPEGRAIYVMTGQGLIYTFNDHQTGRIHHSSLTSGGPVSAAGKISVLDGRITYVDRHSGHYQTTAEQLATFVRRLRELGVSVPDHAIDSFDV